jgi:serine/threonine protein kinase
MKGLEYLHAYGIVHGDIKPGGWGKLLCLACCAQSAIPARNSGPA